MYGNGCIGMYGGMCICAKVVFDSADVVVGTPSLQASTPLLSFFKAG